MPHFDRSSIHELPLTLARQIDAVAVRAEREWRSGQLTTIEQYLQDVPPEGRAGLLEELLTLELTLLQRQGKKPSQQDWAQRFPDFPDIVQRVFDDVEESAQTPSGRNDAAQHRFPKIPGYTIQRPLGRGAMGVVYLARHERLQRMVALKVVAAGIELQRAMSIIRAEAEIIARLKHPHIVQVYDVGEDHGEPYLSLEFVDGESLKERLQREPIPVRQTAELLEQMSRAMHHAHVHGVVHRDLKPANILLPRVATGSSSELNDQKSDESASLVAKISDFGLAKVLDALQEQTQAGSFLGTPKYMSPEQAEGRSREVGPATDVYALGAILFEMLTGQTPFEGESSLKLLQRITEQDVSFPENAVRNLPVDLQAICLKCLEKSPSQRYASAQELADDVRRFLDDFPVLARRPTRFDLFRKFVRRNRGLTVSIALILTTLFAGSIGTLFFAIREAESRRHAETLAQNESTARQNVESLRKKERRDVYWANLRMAHEAYKAGHLDDMQQLLQEVVPRSAADQDLRGFEWHYLSRLSRPDAKVLTSDPNEGRIGFSKDGHWLASPDTDGLIKIWNTSTWERHIELRGHTRNVIDVDFSPDGTKLVSGSRDRTARLWDLQTGEQVSVLEGHDAAVRSVVFSPDGTQLLTADETDTVVLWTADGAKKLWKISRPELFVMDVAWSPDGRHIALGCGLGAALIIAAEDGREIQQFPTNHQFWLTGIAYSPDGTKLATSGGDRKAKIWDLAKTTTPIELAGHSDWVTSLTFSDDGKSLATSSRDGTVMIWNALSGVRRMALKGHSNWVMNVNYSADGQKIASSSLDGTVRIWNPSPDWEFRNFPPLAVSVPAFALADDGKKLLAGGFDGSVSMMDVATGTVLHNLQAHSVYVSSMAVSADGKSFASASHDESIKIWDLESFRERMVLPGHPGDVLSIAFSPKENHLVSAGSDGFVKIWDLVTGQEIHAIKCAGPLLLSVAYSPDGQLLAVASQNKTQIWETSTRRHVRELIGHSHPVQFVTFSHDGNQMATCGADQTICLWETSSGRQLHVIKGHSGIVTSLAFTRDGQRILSGSHDGTVRLWETESGRELLALNQHSDWVNCVSFSPDETYFVSSGNDGVVKLIERQ